MGPIGWVVLASAAVGPVRVAPPGMGLRAADCAPCHADEVAEWSGSRHAVAATNPMFQASWAEWPNGWCLGCHVPDRQGQVDLIGQPAVAGALRPALAEPTPGAWEDGVSCAACHVGDGVILSARPPSASAQDAHPVQVDERLGGADLCAGCHEFNFQVHTPGPFAYSNTPAQATVSEWRRSRHRDQGCAGCHMPAGAHSFVGAHDEDLVRGALQVEVHRRGAQVVAKLSADPPHRIPTGDPFRRIELHLCGPQGCSDPVASGILRRRYRPDEASWTLVADTTLSPWRPRRRLVVLDDAGATRWELWYRYGERRLESGLPAHEVGYVLMSGDLP